MALFHFYDLTYDSFLQFRLFFICFLNCNFKDLIMKELYDLRIVSLNVRGINNKVKRLSIFDWARKKVLM